MGGQDMEAGRRKVLELIDGIDYALFTTHGADGGPLSLQADGMAQAGRTTALSGFFSKKDSRKAKN